MCKGGLGWRGGRGVGGEGGSLVTWSPSGKGSFGWRQGVRRRGEKFGRPWMKYLRVKNGAFWYAPISDVGVCMHYIPDFECFRYQAVSIRRGEGQGGKSHFWFGCTGGRFLAGFSLGPARWSLSCAGPVRPPAAPISALSSLCKPVCLTIGS